MLEPIEDCWNDSSLEYTLALALIMQPGISAVHSLGIPSYCKCFSGMFNWVT